MKFLDYAIVFLVLVVGAFPGFVIWGRKQKVSSNPMDQFSGNAFSWHISQDQSQSEQTSQQFQSGFSGAPQPQRPKWLIPLIVVACVAVLLCAVLGGILIGQFLADGDNSSEELDSSGEYVSYSNENVWFSLQYPEEYTLTEPNINNVLITDNGYDLQVMVEYAYYTTESCLIYNAADFSAQLDADSTVMANWLGTDSYQIISREETEMNGRPCIHYELEVATEEKSLEGAMYIFDSEGTYGCYCLQYFYRPDVEKTELYKQQVEEMISSFQINGVPEESYVLDSCDELGFSYMTKAGMEPLSQMSAWGAFSLLPAGNAQDGALIMLSELDIDASVPVEEAMEEITRACREGNQIITETQIGVVPMGRYTFVEQDLTYNTSGKAYTEHFILFAYGGSYWHIQMGTPADVAEARWSEMADFLVSLRFEEDGYFRNGAGEMASQPADASTTTAIEDLGENVEMVLEDIESRTGFREDGLTPLATVVDLDQDGNYEFLAVYDSNVDNNYTVNYEVWSLPGSDIPMQLGAGELFKQVGSYRGTVGLATLNGVLYLCFESSQYEGDRFVGYRAYLPWNSSELDWENGITLQCAYVVDNEDSGEYFLGEQPITQDAYENFVAAFTEPSVTLDIIGNSSQGDVMPFDALRECYAD
jgi:hypothetical protein